MSCLVKIRSYKDCRAVPLFPCICGDDGTVGAFGAENFAYRCHDVLIRGECHLEPRYCNRCIGYYGDPYPHWDCTVDPPVYCGCYCDPCSAYSHFECVCVGTCATYTCSCQYTVGYMELQCVPNEFKRLGPKSRALVMSFYRAIIERFYIMRATGCECERPSGDTRGFGFDSLFLAGNECPDKRALAGENHRRTFGGTFRDALEYLANSAYVQSGQTSSKCGVHFYPFTPYTGNLGRVSAFMQCAREYANGQPITWWPANPSSRPYYKILGDSCTACLEAIWTLDNSMQSDIRFHLVFNNVSPRPLLRDIAAAYRAYMCANDDICRYVGWRLCAELPDEQLKSISTCGASDLSRCNINSFDEAIHRFFRCGHVSPQRFWLPALALALRMLSTLNAQTVRRGSCIMIPHKRITANFTLPLGAVDRHFVVGSERSCFTICDVNLHCAVTCATLNYSGGFASYKTRHHYFNIDCREWPPISICVTCERPVYACVCVGTCIGPTYPHYYCTCIGCWWDECATPYPHYDYRFLGCYADPYPHYDCSVYPPIYLGCYCDPCSEYCHFECIYCGCYGDPYPHYACLCEGCYGDPYSVYECRCVGTCTYTYCTCNPNRDYVCAACILRWGTRAWCTGSSDDHCASVTMTAIWPDLSGGGFQFGGAAYPARWAVRECDVAFGAVSAFVKGNTNCKRAWVVNKTDRPKHTLGECKDLMTVLGRGLVKAAVQRAMCDLGSGVCGNTFSGTDFPTTANAALLEMVGENHAKNIEVIRCVAEASEASSGGATSLGYHHLRISGPCILAYPTEDERVWDVISPATMWSDGRWLHLGTSGGGSIAFNYDRDYEKTGGCGGCGGCGCDCDCGVVGYSSTCVRHGWSLPRSSVQFGGFFGTFVFNNRAARQTS